MTNVTTILDRYGACRDARVWAIENNASPQASWKACERGDWLLWIVARLGVKRAIVVFAACQCARLALKHTKDPRVLECIEVTEAWTRGERSIEDVRKARAAAYSAAAASRKRTQKDCADLVRKHIPWGLVETALEGE